MVPYYKKLAELRTVLPRNARYLGRPDVELVLVVDEPSEEAQLLHLLDQLPLVRARVIVNDTPHPWRVPSIPINVGLRAALGKFVLVASPESAFVGDVPSRVIEVLSARPDDVLIGRVAFVTFDFGKKYRPDALFEAAVSSDPRFGFAGDYYGSIAASREAFVAIRGYDEALTGWGGDDDNVRARLSMNGAMLVLDRTVKLLHLAPPGGSRSRPKSSLEARRRMFHPSSAEANPGGWGEAFGRVARDWRQLAAADPRPASISADVRPEKLTAGATGRRKSKRPDVLALFSYRYDAHLVPDLIENLRPIVDGWIGYDDRDSTAIFSNEAERRRLLVRRAFEMGARWVLAIDPDERVEHGLAERIDELTASMDRMGWSFALRELYESDRYRIDGVWSTKAVARLFPLRGDFILPAQELHAPWCAFPARPSGFNLYHLKMIDADRRRTRSALYKFLDPDCRHQKAGYDYLADDLGAEFEHIPRGREYFPAHTDDGGLWMPPVAAADSLTPAG